MKILHIDTEKGWRGGERQLFYLAEGLKKRGIFTAVACRKGDVLYRRCTSAGIPVLPLKGMQILDALKVAIYSKDFDVVHAHTAKAQTVAILSKPFHRKPVVYTRRIDYPPGRDPLTRIKFRLTDRIVAVSHRVAEVLESCGIPREKITVIHSSVAPGTTADPEKVKRIRKSLPGEYVIGTVSALSKQKNIPNFILSARKILKRHPTAVFVIVGEGKLRKELEDLVEKTGLKGKVLFLGFKEDVENYIKAFDVFVLSSDHEGLSGAVLQAMILGVPVVSTDAGGVREAVKNFDTGIIVPRRDPEKLAHAVSMLLEDRELRKRLAVNAKAFATRNFSVDRMIDAYLGVYGEVAVG